MLLESENTDCRAVLIDGKKREDVISIDTIAARFTYYIKGEDGQVEVDREGNPSTAVETFSEFTLKY